MNLQQASDYLKTQPTCVLACMSEDGRPMAATVGFSHNKELVFLIGTNRSTRKYKNLQSNKQVAIVVGVEGPQTVQIEGEAKEVSQVDIQERFVRHYEKVPMAKKFATEEGYTYWTITPNWMRFTDYSAKQPIFETKDLA